MQEEYAHTLEQEHQNSGAPANVDIFLFGAALRFYVVVSWNCNDYDDTVWYFIFIVRNILRYGYKWQVIVTSWFSYWNYLTLYSCLKDKRHWVNHYWFASSTHRRRQTPSRSRRSKPGGWFINISSNGTYYSIKSETGYGEFLDLLGSCFINTRLILGDYLSRENGDVMSDKRIAHLGPLLLTWFNFNSSMDVVTYTLK